MKYCNKCQKEKDNHEFNIKNYKSGYVGLRAYCKACEKLERDVWRKSSPKDNERNKAYNREHAEEIRAKKLVKNYWPHLNWQDALKEWTRLFVAQGGHCAICDEAEGLHVDHNHKTLKVRGLLCYNHNNGLGRFQDNPVALIKAANYIVATDNIDKNSPQ
jgi:hypothetical protein